MTRFFVLVNEFLELRMRLDRGNRPERRFAAGRTALSVPAVLRLGSSRKASLSPPRAWLMLAIF